MIFLQAQVIEQAVPVLLQWGIAGVLLLVLLFMFHKLWKYFTDKVKTLEEANSKLIDQMIEMNSMFSKTLIENEKNNLMSINDVTNGLNNLTTNIRDLKQELNDKLK